MGPVRCAAKNAGERGEPGTCWLVDSWFRDAGKDEICRLASGPAVASDILFYL